MVADLFAIASAYAATTKFPQPLHFIQQYPWWSVAVLSVAALLIMIMLYLHDNADSKAEATPSIGKGDEEVNVEDSKLRRSGIWTIKGGRVRIARSKLNKSPVVISADKDRPSAGND